jgi:hypothetical protein
MTEETLPLAELLAKAGDDAGAWRRKQPKIKISDRCTPGRRVRRAGRRVVTLFYSPFRPGCTRCAWLR